MSVLRAEELGEIVEAVWMTVLELPVDEGLPADLMASDYLTASIVIAGAWHGSVRVRASTGFLNHAAAHMFNISPADVEDQDRVDTVTELTNMLGGTVKCLLPETCDLALPEIVTGDHDVDSAQEWSYFNCVGQPLAVSVAQSAPDLSHAA